MREIKFRTFMPDSFGIERMIYPRDLLQFAMRMEFKDVIPMQYTGLKDKNRKEIYEGDILLLNNKNYDPTNDLYYEGRVIVRGTEDLGYTFKPIDPIPESFDSTSMWHVGEEDTTEIIGNIYENPELTKEKSGGIS